MYPQPLLGAALDRLARAIVEHERAEAALVVSARQLASHPDEAARMAFARCEVRARRAGLHVRLCAEQLEAVRRQIRDDRRRVPARFRRQRENLPSELDLASTLALVGHAEQERDAALQSARSEGPAGA